MTNDLEAHRAWLWKNGCEEFLSYGYGKMDMKNFFPMAMERWF
jgi:hypothetical protein